MGRGFTTKYDDATTGTYDINIEMTMKSNRVVVHSNTVFIIGDARGLMHARLPYVNASGLGEAAALKL